MKKDLNYYMNLMYPIVLQEIPKDVGSGWTAYVKELGMYSCYGGGESPEEAIKNMNIVKEELLKDLIKNNLEIPKPNIEF